jgi:hypothetical protein
MSYARLVFLALILAMTSAVAQSVIRAGPVTVSLSATVGRPVTSIAGSPVTSVARVGIFGSADAGAAALKFKYSGVTSGNPAQPTPPNFIVVFPSTGITSTDISNPTVVLIGLNQSVVRDMSAGTYALSVMFSTVDQSVPSQTGIVVILRLSGATTSRYRICGQQR